MKSKQKTKKDKKGSNGASDDDDDGDDEMNFLNLNSLEPSSSRKHRFPPPPEPRIVCNYFLVSELLVWLLAWRNSIAAQTQTTARSKKHRRQQKRGGISFAATRSFPEQKNIELLFRIFVSAKKFHFEARTDLFFSGAVTLPRPTNGTAAVLPMGLSPISLSTQALIKKLALELQIKILFQKLCSLKLRWVPSWPT